MNSMTQRATWQPGVALGLCFCVGCSSVAPPAKLRMTGTYSGRLADGALLTLHVAQKRNAVTGVGVLGSEPITVSGVVSLRAPAALKRGERPAAPAELKLSPSGKTLTLSVDNVVVSLKQQVGAPPPTSGPFNGRFEARQPRPLRLDLQQWGSHIAGAALEQGRSVAVIGRVTAPRKAAGVALFSDESRSKVNVTLSPDGKELTIRGLGGDLRLQRK